MSEFELTERRTGICDWNTGWLGRFLSNKALAVLKFSFSEAKLEHTFRSGRNVIELWARRSLHFRYVFDEGSPEMQNQKLLNGFHLCARAAQEAFIVRCI